MTGITKDEHIAILERKRLGKIADEIAHRVLPEAGSTLRPRADQL